MKILKHIFNITVWTLLGLYVLFIFTSSTPVFQRYVARRLSAVIASKLGTSVSIGRAEVGLLSHLSLYDVNIKDQQGMEMLRAGRISARFDLFPLMNGKIAIQTAQVFGTHAAFYRANADSQPNYQFVVDSLAAKDTTRKSPLDVRINSLIIRHTSIKYDRFDAPSTPGRLNPSHLHLSDISAHFILKTLTSDSLNLNIKRLAFKEQSGLDIGRLSMKMAGGRRQSHLQDFVLRMPGTDIRLGDIHATYRFRGDHFVTPSLHYNGSIEPSTMTLSDIACLLPTLKTFNSTLALSADFSGQGEELKIGHLLVGSTTNDISADLQADVKGLLHHEPQWAADINDLQLSAKTVEFISENLHGRRAEVPAMLERMGSIHLTGTARGKGITELSTHSQLNTEAGNVSLDFNINRQKQFNGYIDTEGIDLRRLFDDNRFGLLATNIDVKGQLPSNGDATLTANGIVHTFDYNGYQYKNIGINGTYGRNILQGKAAIDDPNIGLSLEGSIESAAQTKNVKLRANVLNFSPKAINLSDKWGHALFSGELSADFKASGTNDAIGSIDLNHLSMVSPSDSYELANLHIESGYRNSQHFITMDSDFGTAEITGDFDLNTLSQSITNFVAAKLPTLPGLPKVNPDTRNNFSIQARIHNSDWLQKLVQVPLRLTKPLELAGMVNDQTQQIALECNLPQFFYNDSQYDNCHLNIVSPLNILQYDLSITKLMGDGQHLDLQSTGSAHNNQLAASLVWDNHAEQRMSGKVTTQTTFDITPDGRQQAYISIAPSHMVIRNALWDIEPCHITYSPRHLDVAGVAIRHDQQFLLLSGSASESALDSIQFNMQGIDLEYVLDLVNFHAVEFSGLLTGRGSLRGIFGSLEADAKLQVDGFKFQQGRMGTLSADVTWNKDAEQIDINAVSDDGPDAATYITGYVSPKREHIDLNIRADGTHLDFARSFTESFMSDLEGHAQGALNLAGPLSAINLTGQLVLNGRTHITPTGCTYELKSDTLRLIPDEMTFVHCPIYDIHGNQGIVTGGIHHKDLTRLTFDIFVETPHMLAYDMPDFGEDTFYGTVFANGRVAIRGRESSVVIEADVTPRPGSTFVYNAASPDAISNQEFIEWEGRPQHTTGKAAGQETVGSAAQVTPYAMPSALDRSDLTMRLRINATPDAALRLLMDERTNDYITLRGNGDLQATYYNKGGFNMFGTYRVTEGTYGITIQDIIKKNFIFKEGGTIVFGGDPYDASLNLQAQHTVNGVSLSDLNVGRSFSNTVRVNCLMNISGQVKAPLLDFDLDMPNVNTDEMQMVRSVINGEEEMNQQVIYLLAVGRFYPQGANNAATAEEGPSKTTLAMQSLLSGTISGQINSVLGQVINNNNWNFGANISTGDEGWENAEYEGLISGRLLNNRLLINGQFGYRDNATTATQSFIGDFDIRYLLYPNGNLALKVYNQTNDRYFTHSSLNTQGIGIIMKKDFNGLGDLLGIKKQQGKKSASPQKSSSQMKKSASQKKNNRKDNKKSAKSVK